jgi:hypothetical protein
MRGDGGRWLSRRAVAGLGAVVVLAVAVAIVAAVSSPSGPSGPYPYLANLSLDGSNTPTKAFSKVCGLAVDSEGDVYVSSRGYSTIDVFAPGGDYLGEIEDPAQPCGLGVNSKGGVYAFESATRNVVEFTPNAYPFQGSPSYGPPQEISADRGNNDVAVDPTNGGVYASRDEHVDAFNANGTIGADAVQRVYLAGVTGGAFRLSFEGRRTGPIPFDATDATVARALEALPTIGRSGVSVTQGPKGKWDHMITFMGLHGNADVGPIRGDGSALEGAARKRLDIEQVAEGFSGDIGLEVMQETTDIAACTHGSTRYLFAADSAGPKPDRVYVFAGPSIGAMVHRATIYGRGSPAGSFGFGPQGGRLAADPSNCHVFVYDAKHGVLDEFDATGAYLGQIGSRALRGMEPDSIAVDRSGGPGDGTIYIGSGSPSGARVLAFGLHNLAHR